MNAPDDVRRKVSGTTIGVGLLSAALLALWAWSSRKPLPDIREGEFGGRLVVQWFDKDLFVFRPDPVERFYFKRFNGELILPEEMVTDGGSIPRSQRVFRSYSPWGYAPAFIIHDWLFEAHRCRIEDHQLYSFDESATILTEGILTMMQNEEVDQSVLASVHAAVSSPVALRLWDRDCGVNGLRIDASVISGEPTYEFVLDFD